MMSRCGVIQLWGSGTGNRKMIGLPRSPPPRPPLAPPPSCRYMSLKLWAFPVAIVHSAEVTESGHDGTEQAYIYTYKHDFIREFLSVVFRKVERFNSHTAVHPLRLLDPYSVVGLVIVRLANMANMPPTGVQRQLKSVKQMLGLNRFCIKTKNSISLKYILYKK